MKYHQFADKLNGLKDFGEWYVRNTRFKGDQLVEAEVVFEFNYKSKDEQEEEGES